MCAFHLDNETPMVEVSPLRSPLFRPLDEEGRAFVTGCLDTVVMAMKMYGFEETGYARKPTIDHWCRCAEQLGSPLKFMKWKFAAYYAATVSRIYGEKQDVEHNWLVQTQFDRPDCLVGGKGYMWLRKLERDDAVLFEQWTNTVLYLKKGCPRPSDSEVDKSVDSTFWTLTTPVQALDATARIPDAPWMYRWSEVSDDRVGDILGMDRRMFTEELRRTVKEVYGGTEFTIQDRYSPFFPSTSSNYLNTVRKGGAVGVILESCQDYLSSIRARLPENLVNFGQHDFSSQRSAVAGVPIRTVNDLALREVFSGLYDEVVKKALLERPVAVPLGLKEALKVRVITKGPPMIYTALKPLQKFLWSTMKKHPAFQLIGGPLDNWYIQDRLGSKLKDRERYLSVDYKDATNQMRKWVSEVLVDIISDELHLSESERTLFRRGLVDHVIVQKQNGKVVREAPQMEGQLMGSIVSFPLLCLVNATLLRLAKEYDDNRRYTLADSGIMVNGDDGCLRIGEVGRDIWEKLGRWLGLVPSVGKVYYSRFFLNMNSRTFARQLNAEFVALTRDDGTSYHRQPAFREVKFVNLGLFYGFDRSSSDESNVNAPMRSVAARAHDMLKSCPPGISETVYRMYINRNREDLKALKVPWFLPSHLGGAGMPVMAASDLHADNADLRVARLIWDRQLIDSRFAPPPCPAVWHWKLWQLAQRATKLKGLSLSEDALRKQQLAISQNVRLPPHKMETATSIMNSLVIEQFLLAKDVRNLMTSLKQLQRQPEILQSYYEKLSRFVHSVRANREFPLDKVWPFEYDKLPEARSTLGDEPLFPLDLTVKSSSSFVQYRVALEREISDELEDPWSRVNVTNAHSASLW
jgi:hypothetical protein